MSVAASHSLLAPLSIYTEHGMLLAGHIGQACVPSPFAMDASAPTNVPSGSCSPPASSCSTGTVTGSASSSPAADSSGMAQPLGVASMMGRSSPVSAPPAVSAANSAAVGAQGSYCPGKEWLYRLVTFPAYFTPCLSCCNGNRTPKREQLMTLFDTKYPYKVYCSHCPECQVQGASLLQVRRASFKDVVKAIDICRFGADISGVQQYTLNGSKVIYLNREAAPDKKNANATGAPAMCTVDGRAMMDKSSLYCSLKCKMQAEDAGFTSWLDVQDPSVRILADIAANAPPRPTVACKRAAQPTSSGSSGLTDSGGSSNGRPKKAARTSSSGGTCGAAAGAPAGQGTGGESAAPGAVAACPLANCAPRQRPAMSMQRAASVPHAGAMGGAAVSGPPAGLKPIRTSITPAGSNTSRPSGMNASRQTSAPCSFLDAAMAEPQLGRFSADMGGMSGSSWPVGPSDLDNTLSSSNTLASWESFGSWESNLSSPTLVGLGDNWQDGSLSPALIIAPSHNGAAAQGHCIGGMGGNSEDWWLSSSPTGGFSVAGLASF
eukprot:GHRR01000399.1.p1 GENE.GHRR01000399.1~~GHRR01000399.1.p1  ORF type:complete len:548 (+),score=194.84 GHRR01000399.1:295-1938(+)